MNKPSLTIRPANTGVKRKTASKEYKPTIVVTLNLDEDGAYKAWGKVVKRFMDFSNG